MNMNKSNQITVNIDTKKIESLIEKAIQGAINELAPILERYAKTNHEYKDRSGVLTNSIIAKGLKNYVNLTALAQYAPVVHERDPWLDKTMTDNDKLINDTFDRHIARALAVINS